MADITINNLPRITPNLGGVIPISQDGSTYSSVLAQLSSLPFIPKAFASFDGTFVSNPAYPFNNSPWFNVSTITRDGGNNYTATFQTPMKSSRYVVLLTCSNTSTGFNVSPVVYAPLENTTTSFKFYCFRRSDGTTDTPNYISFVVYEY